MSRKKHRKQHKAQPVGPEVIEPAPEPTENITRYKAVVRSPLGQWWHDNKKRVRIFATVAVVAVIAVYLVIELLRLIFGA